MKLEENHSCGFVHIEDAHIEKAPLTKIPTLSKSMNIDIWVVGTLNQLFARVFSNEAQFSKK